MDPMQLIYHMVRCSTSYMYEFKYIVICLYMSANFVFFSEYIAFIRVNLHLSKYLTDCSIKMYHKVIVLIE